MISGPIKTTIFNIYNNNKTAFLTNAGSQHNHQAWEGGYVDHIVETMNIARLFHQNMSSVRHLDFSLSDALIVLFLHDIEKTQPERIDKYVGTGMLRPKAKDRVRFQMIHEKESFGIWDLLSNEHKNALDFVEGEGDIYSNTRRSMHPLAAFCHICDIASARIWHDRPLEGGEVWGSRQVVDTTEDHNMWGV